MKKKRVSPLWAGIDSLSLDKRNFDPSRGDIEGICRFFAIGMLQHFEKEKNISVSHSNFFVFAATTQGAYALKFYPRNASKIITREYALNRILTHHHFPTPIMNAGLDGQPFVLSNDLLVTCYSYIKGIPVWHDIKHIKTIHQINAALLLLKNILSTSKERIPLQKQERLTTTINGLVQESRSLAPYTHKKIIDASLKDSCRIYQRHQPLFTRQCLHNNAGLTNFLIDQKTVYTLDLSHIKEDYILSDLASLVISCLFRSIPVKTIKTIVKDYFTQHNIGSEGLIVLHALLKIKIISEYLRNIKYEKNLKLSVPSPGLAHTYMPHLLAYKKIAAPLLKGMNNISGLIGTDG